MVNSKSITSGIFLALLTFTPVVYAHTECEKITFDLGQISEAGLIGKEGGQRSMTYEFCIPANPQTLAEVQRIDPTLQYSRSRGRIGCQRDQYLCIGHTHQNDWREVLNQLAKLEYVKQINPFWGE
jgi:hypothetical protein